MEEKKQIKVSLGTVFLVIAIILIVVMGALLYMQKTEADIQIAELKSNASKLQETINNLQGKIDNISNTINGTTEEIKFDAIIELNEIESLDYSNKSQLQSFHSKYEGKTVKITGYVSQIEDNVIVTNVNTAETLVHIGNLTNDEKRIVSGASADLNVRKQINNLKSGQKISIVGVILKGAQPIELNDIKIIVEQEDKDANKNNQENTSKCYTDGTYYWLMLYKTNLNIPYTKNGPAIEQRTFSLMANSGYGQQHLYGWYNIENDKITLRIDTQYNYNYVNNTVNMMNFTQGNEVQVKEDGGQYIITLDYAENVIKYGPYDLNKQSN